MKPHVAKPLSVSKILVTDGMMTDDEKAFFAKIFAKLGLDETERQSVIELEDRDETEARIKARIKARSDDEKRDVVELLVDEAAPDGRRSPNELAEIKSLEPALGLTT